MYKKKSTNKLSMRQQLVILALIIVLPASALMVAFFQAKVWSYNTSKSSVMRIDDNVVNDINTRFDDLLKAKTFARNEINQDDYIELIEESKEVDFSQIFSELNDAFSELGITQEMYYAEVDRLYSESEILDNDSSSIRLLVRGGYLPTWAISVPIDVILIATGSFAAFAGIKLVGKFFGKWMAKALCKSIAPLALKAVKILAPIAMNVTVGKIGDAMFGSFWALSSLGGIIAFVFDMAFDGRNDGVVIRW